MKMVAKKFQLMNISFAVLIILCLELSVMTPKAKATCNPSNTCYAVQNWPGATLGVGGDIDIVNLFTGTGVGGVGVASVSNSISYLDGSGQCSAYYGYCFVQAGYKSFSNYQSNKFYYYWSDLRPNYGYIETPLSNVYYNPNNFQRVYIQIHSDYYRPQQVDVFFSSNAGVTNTHCSSDPSVQQCSTSNSMGIYVNSNLIQIGLQFQVVSPAHAYAPGTGFTYNQWIDNTRTFQFQNNYGYGIQQDQPPYATWAPGPGGNSNQGGSLAAYCDSTTNLCA